jgi:hypothetical protein
MKNKINDKEEKDQMLKTSSYKVHTFKLHATINKNYQNVTRKNSYVFKTNMITFLLRLYCFSMYVILRQRHSLAFVRKPILY